MYNIPHTANIGERVGINISTGTKRIMFITVTEKKIAVTEINAFSIMFNSPRCTIRPPIAIKNKVVKTFHHQSILRTVLMIVGHFARHISHSWRLLICSHFMRHSWWTGVLHLHGKINVFVCSRQYLHCI